jgi:hypothetical protein
MAAGKRAVIWQDSSGNLLATIVATSDAVARQATEIEAAGCRFLGAAAVLNVDDSRVRRAAAQEEPSAPADPFTVIAAFTASGDPGITAAAVRAWHADGDATGFIEERLGPPAAKGSTTGYLDPGAIAAAVTGAFLALDSAGRGAERS